MLKSQLFRYFFLVFSWMNGAIIIFSSLCSPIFAQIIPTAQPTVNGGLSLGNFHKIRFGYTNIGYQKHIFFEYTGESVYKKSFTPSYPTWFAYEYLVPISFPVVSSYSFGGEYHYIAADSTALFKETVSLAYKPKFIITQQMANVLAKIYIPLHKNIRLSVGGGVGVIQGKINGTYFSTSRQKFSSNIEGLFSYRDVGIALKTTRWSVGYLFRLVNAPSVKFNNDQFNRSAGSTHSIDMTAFMNSFYFAYQF